MGDRVVKVTDWPQAKYHKYGFKSCRPVVSNSEVFMPFMDHDIMLKCKVFGYFIYHLETKVWRDEQIKGTNDVNRGSLYIPNLQVYGV